MAIKAKGKANTVIRAVIPTAVKKPPEGFLLTHKRSIAVFSNTVSQYTTHIIITMATMITKVALGNQY